MKIDADLLERVLTPLTSDDAAVVSAALETPSNARQRRLDARDALIRKALADATGASMTIRAGELQRRLTRGTGRGLACSDRSTTARW